MNHFLKHKHDILFSFFTYKTLRAIFTLSCKNCFQSSSDGKVIPSHLLLLMNVLIFVILSACFLISSWSNATVTAYWKHLLSFLLMGFIVASLSFIQSGESKYDPPWFGFILWHLYYNKWTWSNTNSLPFIDSKLFWYLFLRESKSYSIT